MIINHFAFMLTGRPLILKNLALVRDFVFDISLSDLWKVHKLIKV